MAGARSTSRAVAYERIPVTQADKDAEMAEANRVLAEQIKAAQRSIPPGFALDINMTPSTWGGWRFGRRGGVRIGSAR